MVLTSDIKKTKSVESTNSNLFYAFADEELKTWFITKDKNFKFGNTHILYEIIGKKSNLPIMTTKTYPEKGNIVDTTDSGKIEIVEINDYLG